MKTNQVQIMERTDKQLFDGAFTHLGKLASFIIEQKLNSFVMDHLERCSAYDFLSLNRLPAYRRNETLNVFRQSCENWLQTLSIYTDEKSIQKSIEDAFEHELLTMGNNELTIDDIVMINCIRSESLKSWIGEYTSNVSIALAIVKELDNFIATYNRIAFQRYSRILVSNLETKNNTLRESNEKLKEFAAVVSHDLKAPLRKISTYLGLIQEVISQGDTSNFSLYLNKTKAATGKMSQLIENLLTFSSLDDQQHETGSCDLQNVIEEVLENLEPAIKEKNASIILDKLPTINAVSFQMTQLFQNLLANSLKFCKKDLPPIVLVSNHQIMKEGRPFLRIEVKDNCIGFKNEYSDKVFSVFSRLHSDYEGTGLGLSICKKIVDNHAGSISVNSEEGVGTVFRIDLPMTRKQSSKPQSLNVSGESQ